MQNSSKRYYIFNSNFKSARGANKGEYGMLHTVATVLNGPQEARIFWLVNQRRYQILKIGTIKKTMLENQILP